MKTPTLFDQALPRRDTPSAQPALVPAVDPKARELIAADPAASDADLLACAEEILARATAAVETLRQDERFAEANALLELGRLLGASARRRRSREECDGL